MLQDQQGTDEIWKESSRHPPNCRICRLFCWSWSTSWILSALRMMLPLPCVPTSKVSFFLGQDRWVLQDSNKASKCDCESEKPQHTKLFSRDQRSSQVSSTSQPCLSFLPPLPCSLWPVDKLMNPGATSTDRRERKYGWTTAIALGSTSKCLNKGGSHGVSSPYLCPQAFSQTRLKRSFPAPLFCLSWISFCGSWFSVAV